MCIVQSHLFGAPSFINTATLIRRQHPKHAARKSSAKAPRQFRRNLLAGRSKWLFLQGALVIGIVLTQIIDKLYFAFQSMEPSTHKAFLQARQFKQQEFPEENRGLSLGGGSGLSNAFSKVAPNKKFRKGSIQNNLREKELFEEEDFDWKVNMNDQQLSLLRDIPNNLVWNGKTYSLETNYSDLSKILPLPTPILVVGLPKAGTSTIYNFFDQAGYLAAHWRMNTSLGWSGGRNNLVGICMRQALQESKPLLEACGDFEVWAQMDVAESAEDCVFPQISYLEQIHKEAPNATFILNRRNLEDWVHSVARWKGGKGGGSKDRKPLLDRLVECPIGPKSEAEEDLMDWHLQQIQRIRQFAKDHPSHPLLEIDIEDPVTAEKMAMAFDIPFYFWGHANHNSMATVSEPSFPPLTTISNNIIVNGLGFSTVDVDLLNETAVLPLPTPIIVVGLPKAGTSTLWHFFEQAGYNTAHWKIDREEDNIPSNLIGICMRDALDRLLLPLQECGDFEVWAQLDVEISPQECFFPQISCLEEIHNEVPSATFVLNRRDMDRWASSVERWKPAQWSEQGTLAERLAQCADGPESANASALIAWHVDHIQRIREFVRDHPSHALMEIDIEDPQTAVFMADIFQASPDFWGHANHNNKTKPLFS